MDVLDSLMDKASKASETMKYSNGSVEEAVNHIGQEIAEDVEKGDFQEARKTLKSRLDELMSGEMKTERYSGGGNRNRKWDSPEEEAKQVVNRIYLFLLEMSVEDLEGIDSHLEPPILTSWVKWEDGLTGRIEKLQRIHSKVEKAYPDEIIKKEIDQNTPKWYIEEYYYAQNWSEKRPNYHTLKDGVKAKVKRWKWLSKSEWKIIYYMREVLGTDQEHEHENTGDARIFQYVIRAKRRIEFIEKLIEWEEEEYGLGIERSELEEIKEVQDWIKEREKIIRELEEVLGPLNGENKYEHFSNIQEVEERFNKAESILEKLERERGTEDEKLEKLESLLP